MIEECFVHCHGIGPKTDSRLRELGYGNWNDCFEKQEKLPFKGKKRSRFIDVLRRSMDALLKEDIAFFVKQYPVKEHWRILARWFNRATFFDIETTGFSWYDSQISVISAYRRGELYSFVCDENLDEFLDLLDSSEVLVTFNGNSFDLPFVERSFHIPEIEIPHIDLRWVAYHHGYRGGLKSIEREIGIRRPEDLTDVDGFEAVELFYRWQDGDKSSRDRLVKYCGADVISTYLVASYLLHGSDILTGDGGNELFSLLR